MARSGFTLIEILVSIGILVVLVSMTVMGLGAYKGKTSFDLDVNQVVAALRSAQSRAVSQDRGQGWGVQFTNSTTTGSQYQLFWGTSYATSSVVSARTLGYSSVFTDPAPGFSKTILFAPVSGASAGPDVIVIKNTTTNNVGIITISALGLVGQTTESGLVGYWPMDEGVGTSAYDASGNNNGGTIYGSSVWVAGLSNWALGLTTGAIANNVIATAKNISNPQGLTLTAWVYPTSYSAEEMTVVEGQSPNGYYLSVYKDGSINCYWYGTSPAGYHSSGAGTVPLNQWTQITCAWSGSAINLYTNGQLKNTVSVSGSGVIATVVNIGAESTSRQFRGKIDDVRVYNRALSATEVKNLFNSY
ncbi:MAG: LamG-like jellyroll fold domain-containing protein [Candidatus Paceibacterota bacterium]|jgi:prepilin-type N-terminal cleavage/methylation domain-containing protein